MYRKYKVSGRPLVKRDFVLLIYNLLFTVSSPYRSCSACRLKHHLAAIRRAMRFCNTPVSTRITAARSNSRVEMAGSIGSIS